MITIPIWLFWLLCASTPFTVGFFLCDRQFWKLAEQNDRLYELAQEAMNELKGLEGAGE